MEHTLQTLYCKCNYTYCCVMRKLLSLIELILSVNKYIEIEINVRHATLHNTYMHRTTYSNTDPVPVQHSGQNDSAVGPMRSFKTQQCLPLTDIN